MFPTSLIANLAVYKYLITFLAALVEGPVVMTVSGFMLRLGAFTFWPLYLTLMAGDLAADTLWYAGGYFYGHRIVSRYGKYFSITEELVQKTKEAFHRHQNKILFLSKITMGFGFAVLVLLTAGIVRAPFKKYLAFNAIGQFVWTGILLSVGYYFGSFYLTLNAAFRDVSLVAFIVIVVALLYGANRYLRSRDIARML
jgi:membrane protein DedA with SNARE-associated domain